MNFKLESNFKPAGSQPKAINQLIEKINQSTFDKKKSVQTLVGVTGSGKSFTMANVINKINKPTLVIAHNKTLAAQLYREFQSFFPKNRVEYFVSFYDYYQPESYIASKDLYIEKDSQTNSKIEQLRLSSTVSLSSRNDCIIVASVSSIFGLGNPVHFANLAFQLKVGDKIKRNDIILKLVTALYERSDFEIDKGKFRVKGDVIDIIPGYAENIIRIEMFGNEIDRIIEIDKLNGHTLNNFKDLFIYPARHFVIPELDKIKAIKEIRTELENILPTLDLLERHRLKQRTEFDLEMIEETGTCKGIENYSRYFDFRKAGEKPYCLLDYFPDDFLMIIDESHQSIPQIRAMYAGDFSRKKSLVDFGFRLPSAFDNRPLKFKEFEKYLNNAVFVSATPGDYEKENSSQLVEQIIRPTGLLDPKVYVKPIKNQINNIKSEITKNIKKGHRIIITTLTKKSAEELTEFLSSNGFKTRYLHSEIKTLERTEIIREFREGVFDCLVGINLLREGLDIPEVGFIAILDADKEGFLRDTRSLIQIIGRAARNADSYVNLYADKITDSMKRAIEETKRRRKLQMDYNNKNNIIPKTIKKEIPEKQIEISDTKHIPKKEIASMILRLDEEMREASDRLDFELAISLRDKIVLLKKRDSKHTSRYT